MTNEEQLELLLESIDLVDVRLVCVRSDTGWHIKRLHSKPQLAEPAVPERVQYQTHLFLRASMSASDFLAFVNALESEGATIMMQGLDLEHAKLYLSSAQHFQGYVRWGLVSSPLPSWHFSGDWSPMQNTSLYERVNEPLAGSGTVPYFPRVIDGEAWYLFDKGLNQPTDSLPTVEIMFEDKRAYFAGVDISGDTYIVFCDGTELDSCQLHLYTSAPQVEQQPAKPINSFEIKGEPGTIALALTYQDEWLDRREVNPNGLFTPWSADDIHLAQAVDQELSIKELIARRGESLTLEFKESAGESGKPEKNRFLQTVVAFANTQGGTILLGVDDDGTVVGVKSHDTKERILNLVESSIKAVPQIEIIPQEVDGFEVLVVHVAEGVEKPYGLPIPGGEKYLYYMRRDGSNKHAKPEDFRAMHARVESQGSPSGTDAFLRYLH